jgi:hypothetical protein
MQVACSGSTPAVHLFDYAQFTIYQPYPRTHSQISMLHALNADQRAWGQAYRL